MPLAAERESVVVERAVLVVSVPRLVPAVAVVGAQEPALSSRKQPRQLPAPGRAKLSQQSVDTHSSSFRSPLQGLKIQDLDFAAAD
jgi:hypothetical protein